MKAYVNDYLLNTQQLNRIVKCCDDGTATKEDAHHLLLHMSSMNDIHIDKIHDLEESVKYLERVCRMFVYTSVFITIMSVVTYYIAICKH